MASPRSHGANVLAALGVFSLIGATVSGWMCDRFNPRILLFWYYGLRGLSLIVIPFTQFDLGQPVDLLGFIPARLGRHRPRHFRLGQ